MIVPMTKVSLILLRSEKTAALKKLRRLGLVHIEITEGAGTEIETLRQQMQTLEGCINRLGKPEKGAPAKAMTPAEALAMAADVAAMDQAQQDCRSEQAALQAELARLAPWGEVDPAALEGCAADGVDLALYEIPAAEYDRLDERVRTVRLERTKSAVKCAVIPTGAEGEAEALEALRPYRLRLPRQSTAAMRQRLEELERQSAEREEKLSACAGETGGMALALQALQKELEFETYATGMDEADLSAAGGGVAVAYFQGYLETEHLDRLKKAARENAWGLLAEEPTEDDNVPTKLKNNRFVSLIYPITDFLGTVPGYFEFDISGWFLAFLLVFFGIIFGDGGYGLLICAIAAAAMVKARLSRKPIPATFLLVGLFGVATVLCGLVTCSWFGADPAVLPQWLRSLSVPVLSNVNADRLWYPFGGSVGLTTSQNVQIFCFTLALIQLSVAHLMCAARNRRSLKVLGDIGAFLELLGIYYLVLSLVVSSAVFPFGLVVAGVPVGTVAIVLIAGGFAMNFVFSNYEGSIGKSILASLVNIVSMLLGVVNVFSDIVSYIRLWAVGLAGAAISATVNEMAGPLVGNFLFTILAIVLLVFGHGLNMILNVLSVIVHGIRLNTLEFSSHLDMSWSGHKFQPFQE